MLGEGSPRRVRLGAGLAVAAVAVAARLAEAHGRLDRVTLAGGADPVAEVNRWLPWQLWDNLANHRAPFDASVFSEGTGSLLDVVGNPGIALLSFGFHAGGSASVGAGLGVLLVLVLNVLGGAAYGGAFRSPWLGALAGAAAWGVTGAAGGHAAQVCVGPAAMAGAAWLAERRGLAIGLTLLGAVVAPLPSAAFLLGAGLFPLAAVAALGLVAAPLGTWGASGVGGVDLVWPAGRAARALPLALPLAGVACWNGGKRSAAALLLVGVLLGIAPAAVAGARILPALAPGSGAALAAAVALVFAAALPLVARLVSPRRVALGVFLAADALGPILAGGGAAWAPRPAPSEVLRALGATPRAGVVITAPDERVPAAGVGAIPVHRQRVGWAPSRAALEGGQAEQRHMVSEDGVAQLVRSSNSPVVLDLRDVPADVLSSYASELGPPDELTATGALWRWP